MSKGGRFLEQKAPEKGNTWVKVLVIVLAAVFCLAMAYSARIEAALLRLVTRLTGGRKEKRP